MEIIDWNKRAASILKAEIKRKNITYENLAHLLNKINVQETHNSILSKMSRGSFSFSFFLQCAAAIGITNIRFNEILGDLLKK